MTAVMIAMMFIIASESIFSSYGEVKVRNAYRYNGVWDYRLKTSSDENIKVDGVTYRGYAENQNIGILDIIPEMEHIGNYEGKKVTVVDEKYFRQAEEQLFGELAFALDVDKTKISEMISERF